MIIKIKYIVFLSLLLIACNDHVGSPAPTNKDALYSDKYVCISDYLTGKELAKCRSQGTLVQKKFQSSVGNLIEHDIIEHHYLTSTSGLMQPTNVIADWDTLSDLDKAQKISAYGFALQNSVLPHFLSASCMILMHDYNGLCLKTFVAPSAKSVDRILEKASKGINSVLDLSRATVVVSYNDTPKLLQAMEKVSILGGLSYPSIKVVKDRLYNPTSTHYRDVQVLVTDKTTGFISEILILGSKMDLEKNGTSHKLYEEIRTKEDQISKDKALIEEWKKKTPVPIDDIKKLEDEIEKLKAEIEIIMQQIRRIHDNIFIIDASTSCDIAERAQCTEELKKYLNV